VPLKVVAGALIVLALLGSLELVMRATAITTQALVGDSTFQLEFQSAHATGMQSEAIPLPTRNPRSVYSVSNETGSIPRPKERMTQQKRCAAQAEALSAILSSFWSLKVANQIANQLYVTPRHFKGNIADAANRFLA
jgi:hypothetical protein